MMDLIVTLRKSLIENDLTKIREIEAVCLTTLMVHVVRIIGLLKTYSGIYLRRRF